MSPNGLAKKGAMQLEPQPNKAAGKIVVANLILSQQYQHALTMSERETDDS